jgi:hypothetical protein
VPFLGTRGAGSNRAFGYAGAAKPNQVTGLTATDFGTSRAYNNGRIDLSWTAPSDNGATISGYLIERSTDNSTYSTLVANTGTSGTTYSDTGLNSAQIYYYKVSAINAAGTSDASAAANATATTVPQAPVITAANVGTGRAYNNGAATITATGGATGGKTISSYTAVSSPSSFTASGSSPVTVTGLASATAYTFSVTATNDNGTSTATTSNSITATTVPQAPTIGSATAGDASATVAYTANATGGAAVSIFTATSSPGSVTGTGSSPISVSGLSAGTAYTFTVTATNANGTSTASSASNSVTPVSYFTMGWSSYYPYNIASRTGGFALTGYSSGPGMGNALVNDSGAVITNGNKYPNTSNGSGTQRNAYGVDASGNIYWTSSATNKLYVISQDSSGTVRWQKQITNPINSNNAIYWGGASLGKDGNFYIWGTWIAAGPSSVPFFVKLNGSTGNQVWAKSFTESNGPRSVAVDASGNVCIQYSTSFIVGYNSSGTQTFKKSVDTGNYYVNSAAGSVADSSGNFYMAIRTGNNSGAPAVVKVDSSGGALWARRVSYPVSGKGADWSSGSTTLTTDSSNNVYMLHNGNTAESGGCVVKFDSSGNTSWKRRLNMVNYASGGAVYPYSISVDSTNSLYYMCGQTIFGNPYGNVGWVFKLPTDGTKTSSSYDVLGGGFTMGYADSGSLTVASNGLTTTNSTYITIGTSAPSIADSSLTFTTTSNFNGNTAVVTTI